MNFTGARLAGTTSMRSAGSAAICAAEFPSDDRTLCWFTQQAREHDFEPLTADEHAVYDETIRIDLSELVPLIAVPHSPGNVLPVADLPDPPSHRPVWAPR